MHIHSKKVSSTTRIQGFSLVEILVAAVLLGLISSATAVAFNAANKSSRNSAITARTSVAIDNNISQIKEISESLTWNCAAGKFDISSNCTVNPRSSSYYFPTTDIVKFTAACNSTAIVSSLAALINASIPFSEPGTTRSIAIDAQNPGQPTADEISAHRIKVSYISASRGNSSFANRTIKIVPTVANWCP